MRPAQTEYALETSRKYAGCFGAWCRWALARHTHPLPACGRDVAAYLLHLGDRGYALATVKQVRWAIDAMHRRAGHPPPDVSHAWRELLKRARGRERRDPGRTHAVQFRVSGAELEQLKAAARAARCSLGRLLRARALAT